MWKLYETIVNDSDKLNHKQKNSKIKCLKIPILCLLYELVNCAEIKSFNYAFTLNQKVLDYLINLINSDDMSHENDDEELQHIKIISKHILLNGIDVFFPTFELRKQCLMLMLDLNLSQNTENTNQRIELPASEKMETNSFNSYLSNIANKKSSNLLFEAFCNLFYNAKSSLLVDLSIKNLLNYSLNESESAQKMQESFNLVSKIIDLSINGNIMNENNIDDKYSIVNKLSNKIQSYICYKCRKLLVYLAKSSSNEQQHFGDRNDHETIKQIDLANNLKLKKRLRSSLELFLINYTRLLATKFDLFFSKSDRTISYSSSEKFLILTLHHYVLWLIEFVNVFSIKTCTTMLNLILDVEKLLNKANLFENETVSTIAATPEQTPTCDSNTDEIVLRDWHIDTKSYSTLNNLSIDFNCIGASRYHIVFDENCEIKNNIDTFEFIDSDDEHHACTGYKVGCDSWKKELNINSHNFLKFSLITHKTIVPLEENIKIKFICKAFGYGNMSENVPLTTQSKSANTSINDLRTSITCLVGLYCSHIYTQRLNKFEKTKDESKSKANDVINDKEDAEKVKDDSVLDGGEPTKSPEEANSPSTEVIPPKEENNYYYFDLNSYLYKTLLRGGLLEVNSAKNKLVRSYSGIHESIGMNDKMNKFLMNLIENRNDTPLVADFLKLYENYCEKIKKPKIGGERVNKAVLSVFAALIWHTPVIKRNDIVSDEDEEETSKLVNEHIAQAYKAAEMTRFLIVEQQQLCKLAGNWFGNNENKKSDDSDSEEEYYEDFIEMVTCKAIFLLKISRLTKIPMKTELYNDYEDENDKNNSGLSKSRIKKPNHHHHHHHGQSSQKNLIPNVSATTTTTTTTTTAILKLPKNDAYPTFNLIIEFIFDKLINLKLITKILNHKRENAKSISEAFKIAKEYLEINIDHPEKKTQMQLECLLTFLSCFFNLKPQQYGIHYLQNLYGCGLNLEKLVRESYYEFLKLIFNFIKTYQVNHENGTLTPYELDIYIRLESYLLHFFNIDWELYDWKFILDIKLETFLIKNCYLNLSLTKHEYDANDPNSKKPMEILENIFEINENKVDEGVEMGKEVEVKNSVDDMDENSFDLKFYPKLYKQYFVSQTVPVSAVASLTTITNNSLNNSKSFNTEELIDCLSRDTTSHEQKVKFHVARYIAWKYFYKQKVNFTCDICDILLVGNRYQCIDCRDFSMCFTCFAKSCVDFKSNYTKMKVEDEDKASSAKKESEQHKPEHRVLLLDHCCDNCGALIIGKRIHCEQCEDYDLCLMCHKMLDDTKTDHTKECDLEEIGGSQLHNQNQHNKSHKFIVIEPNIYYGKLLKNNNLQLYTYLHSQILFSILTLKLTRLLAYSANVNSQEKASLIINDDLVYYKDINLLHSNCIKLIIKSLNHIYSPKVYFQTSDTIQQKLEIFSTYSQEILVGLLTTIIQSNVTNLVDNSIKFSINEIVCSLNATNDDDDDDDDDEQHVFSLYELISYLISIIIKRNDYYYEENLIYMIINAIIKLLEYSEPHKIDMIMYCLVNEKTNSDILESDIESCIKSETKFRVDGELTLDFIIEWINEGVQCAQIDLIYNYIKLICKLGLNKNWKPAVESLFNRLLDTLIEMNSSGEKMNENEQKILNFLCALIFTPVIVFSGQWVEYKAIDESFHSSNHNDNSTQQTEYKNALLKCQCYDEANHGFNLTLIDLVSRSCLYLKGLQNDIHFRRSVNITQFDCLHLSLESCSKLIKLYKKLLSFNSTCQSVNSAVRYTNLKQLSLKHNLILLCITILLKDYQSKYAEYLENKKLTNTCASSVNPYFDSNENDEESLKKLFIDYDFIRLVSEIGHLGTGMDSDWQLNHLQTYLFRLLMKDGFSNLNDEFSGDESESEVTIVEELNTNAAANSSKKATTKKSKDDAKNQQKQQEQQTIARLDKGLESIDIKTKISVIERLKLDLTTYSVVGFDDSFNNYLCDNQDKQDDKLNKRIYNRRLKKSFKLLKDATDKMIFRSQTSSSSQNFFSKNDQSQGNSPNKPSNKSINQIAVNTSSISAESSGFSSTNAPLAINSVIKKIDIASLILNSRELLIFLVNNWPKNSETITASHLNCKNETDIIEFLYLLYNSIDINKYKLIVHNIVSLLDVNSLSKICLLASNYLLPDYRFIKSVDWKSDLPNSNDCGEFKRNMINKVINTSNGSKKSNNTGKILKEDSDESINIGNASSSNSELNDLPLVTSISSLDYTLLIVFGFDKIKINATNNRFNSHKLKQKYKGFKKDVNIMLSKTSETVETVPEPEGDNNEEGDDFTAKNEDQADKEEKHTNSEVSSSSSSGDDEDKNDYEDEDDDDDDGDVDSYLTHKKKSKKESESATKLLFFISESRRVESGNSIR